MTKDEALKLALDVLVEMTPSGPNGSAIWHKQMSAITSASEALAQPEQEQSGFFSREAMKAHSDFHVAQPEQKPVAWRVSPRYEDLDGYFDFTDSKDTAETLQQRGWEITPMYTTPPQRTWVWLTDEEERQIKEHCTTVACVLKTVKAKLKEKNA